MREGHERLAAAVLALLLLAGCRREEHGPPVIRQTRMLLGTFVEITAAAPAAEAQAAFEAAFAEMGRINELLGSHEQRGEISAVNTGGWPGGAAASPEVLGIVESARAIGRESGGAFDITVGPLMDLWDFDGGGRVPTAGDLERARGAVGWDRLAVDGEERRITFLVPGMKLDLGGYGKGYAVDRAVELLRARGVPAGIVNAGGDLRAWGGKPPGGGPWAVGIQHPRDPDRLIGALAVTDRAVVTSGDYEKWFAAGGRRYHHIIDPATGYPATGSQSVTVVAARAAEADAWATALAVMGPERARRLLEGRPDLEAIIVDDGGGVWISPGLKRDFRRQD